MSLLQLFAVTPSGAQPLAVPTTAQDFTDLYQGVELGVYSVLRTFDHNKFLYLESHLARTVQSMRLLGWSYALDLPSLRQALDSCCTAFPTAEVRVRIDVLAAPAQALGSESRVLLALMPFTPLPARTYETGVALGFAEGVIRANPLVKTADFVAVRQALAKDRTNYFERLIVNAAGEVLEGTSSNFYGFYQGALHTAGRGVLEGITRKIILELAQELGIPVRLEALTIAQLTDLDEAALSSSSRGLLPVVQIADQPIANGKPGPLTQQLMAAYDAFVARTVQRAYP